MNLENKKSFIPKVSIIGAGSVGSTFAFSLMASGLAREIVLVDRNENSVLPVSTLINDYYGINDVCLSTPSIVNKNGIERFFSLELAPQEEKEFKHSAATLKEIIKNIKF